jgi:hypothetical protein
MASLNGATPGGWIDYARLMEQAGADALELNLYRIATDPDATGESIEREAIETVRAVKKPWRSQWPSNYRRSTPPSPTSPGRSTRPAPTDWSCSTASISPISTPRS